MSNSIDKSYLISYANLLCFIASWITEKHVYDHVDASHETNTKETTLSRSSLIDSSPTKSLFHYLSIKITSVPKRHTIWIRLCIIACFPLSVLLIIKMLPVLHTITHLLLDKMAAISQTIYLDGFPWMENCTFWLKFHWSLFLRVPLTMSALVQVMVWRRIGGKPLSEPSITWFSDAYMRH